MSKPLFIVIIVTSFVVLFGSFTGYMIFVKDKEISSPIVGRQREDSETEIPTEIYKDESGFSFKYPKGAKVSDVTPDEEVYYSVLEITHTEKTGKITISIKNTSSQDTDEWLAEDKQMKMAEIVGATSLGNLSAKQASLRRGGLKIISTIAIDQNILYLIEGPKDDGYWEEVQNLIASSFVIGRRPVSGSSSGSGESNVIYEEEEVIE